MNYDIDDVLLHFAPVWRPQLLQIIQKPNLVISSYPIKIRPYPTHKQEQEIIYTNCFELEIPFGGLILKWDVFLNEEDYEFPPDFDFKCDMFLVDPDLELINGSIPSLLHWDINNSKAFLNVIKEFLDLYKKLQLDILDADQKFKMICDEYDLSLKEPKLKDYNLEIFVNKKTINILIDLNIKFDYLPTYNRDEKIHVNPSEDKALLKLCSSGKKLIPYLYLSPRLEQSLGNSSTLIIPPLKKKPLIEYLSEIENLLMERVGVIENRVKSRNEYISNLLSELSDNLVEYDNENFMQATFFVENTNFFCLIHINIPEKFPIEQPNLLLQSVLHEKNDEPYFETLSDYPYSPRWNVEEMTKKVIVYLPQAIAEFEKKCNNLSSIL